MNKKILLIVAALLAVSLVATPLLAGARKSKAAIHLVFYNLELVGDIETKECGRVIVETSRWTSQILVLFPGMPPGMPIPHAYGGTAEGFIAKMYDPETGYGTVKSRHTWDFGEYGSFKVYGWGNCGGKMLGIPGLFSTENRYGYGRDAMKGTRLRLVSSIQLSLPNFMGHLPPDFVGTMGLFSAGEIIY